MVIIGIDPGINGGITVLNSDGDILYKEIMPVIDGSINTRAVVETIKLHTFFDKDSFIFIEKVHSMPKQGVASTFKFGMGYGILQGICSALDIEYHLISPQKWQKEIFPRQRKKNTKEASAAFCKKNWPEEDWRKSTRSKKPHDGMTDSACIAEYGRKVI